MNLRDRGNEAMEGYQAKARSNRSDYGGWSDRAESCAGSESGRWSGARSDSGVQDYYGPWKHNKNQGSW